MTGKESCDSHGHGSHASCEKLVKVTLNLEEDQVVVLKELAKQYSKDLGQRWSMSAVARVAVGAFLADIGRIT
ncbi:hypothetical protein MNBD_DELTA02-1192 [hydrothermal vent metagenome]|uniref:Uncharacterized protein n=1 Tax=hydrothermal vent metagenome TaxID=652676 RepID=A0A3B0VAD1_9ZZZZ